MNSEIIMVIILSIVTCITLVILWKNKKTVKYKNNVSLNKNDYYKEEVLEKLTVFNMSNNLKRQMSFSNIDIDEEDAKVINSGPDTCVSRKIKLRSFGDDIELVINEQDVRMS